jgi:hypothetical protein
MENTAVPGGTVATDETLNLISADKVVGTSVYNRQGEKLGSLYTLMLNICVAVAMNFLRKTA